VQIGIDSFAAGFEFADSTDPSTSLRLLVDRVVHAEEAGLDVFGIGEHHRAEFYDSAPAVILAAAAARTERIRLTSAVTVLSAVDPVRAFQQFATLDLLSAGRAEMVVGRGSFTEAFPLFGLDLWHYDELFSENLELLLAIRADERVEWTGKHRAPLTGQGVYPRPKQEQLPIWVGVGGTPESFVRAGMLGLPLMVAIIGGDIRRFRPLVDLYRQAGESAGHPASSLAVGVHALGYVADTDELAVSEFYPGYERFFGAAGRERGWSPITPRMFEAQRGGYGALLVGGPEMVAEGIARFDEALGGISRLTLQMDVGLVSHPRLVRAIELIGSEIRPRLVAVGAGQG
jgi:probable LLM family oxidoreductase